MVVVIVILMVIGDNDDATCPWLYGGVGDSQWTPVMAANSNKTPIPQRSPPWHRHSTAQHTYRTNHAA